MRTRHEISDWKITLLFSASGAWVPPKAWILWPWVYLSCPKSRQGSVRDWALSHCERALSPWRAVGYWEQQANQLNHWRRAPLGGATFPSNANSHRQLYTSKQFLNVLLWWWSGWSGGWIRWIRCCKYVLRLVILPLPCHDYDGAAVNSMSHNEPLSDWGFWEEEEKTNNIRNWIWGGAGDLWGPGHRTIHLPLYSVAAQAKQPSWLGTRPKSQNPESYSELVKQS